VFRVTKQDWRGDAEDWHKMKIAIVTFAWSKNYGAALQAYALQSILKGFGNEVFIVPINPERRHGLFRRFIGRGFYATWRKSKEWLLFRSFDAFRRKYYDFAGLNWGDYADFMSTCPKADMFIVGSDQVWNLSVMQSSLEEDFYFLKMCPDSVRRVAYAASWALPEISGEAEARLAPALRKFHSISVRERSGVDIVQHMGIFAEWLPDPTILLTAREWVERLSLNVSSKKTLFVYQLSWDSDFDCVMAAKRIGCEKGLSVCDSYPCGWKFLSPCKWVETLASSSHVITNSYHGTVFSILFHVPFSVVLINGRFSGMNERVVALLERVGLMSRIVRRPEEIVENMDRQIMWAAVDKELGKWREEAFGFLDRACAK